jgi:hypothetical protein
MQTRRQDIRENRSGVALVLMRKKVFVRFLKLFKFAKATNAFQSLEIDTTDNRIFILSSESIKVSSYIPLLIQIKRIY